MRLSSQEEYGLRCLLAVATLAVPDSEEPVTIERIATREGLGYEHTAKILRCLRRGGLVESTRGVNGGYRLSRPVEAITVWDALVALDPPLVGAGFCETFKGQLPACAHAGPSCNLRALWSHVGNVLEGGLRQMTLEDLIKGDVPSATRPELESA